MSSAQLACCLCVLAAILNSSSALLDNLNILPGILDLDPHESGIFGVISSARLQTCPMTKNTNKDVSEVNIFLYSPEEPEGCKYPVHQAAELLLAKSNFDIKRPTTIICPGFKTEHKPFADSFLSAFSDHRHNTNFFFIDHYFYTHSSFLEYASYQKTITYIHSIFFAVAKFLAALLKAGLILPKLDIIGHSFGAQSIGVMCQHFHELTNEICPRCIGLDPCGPCMIAASIDYKLDASDAHCVHCYHSSPGQMGTTDAICHANFYLNGNVSTQPGCGGDGSLKSKLQPDMACSHIRAIPVFLESVSDTDSLYAVQCDSWDAFQNGECSSREVIRAGYAAPSDAKGIYILRTKDKSNYCIGKEGAEPSKEKNNKKDALGLGLAKEDKEPCADEKQDNGALGLGL